MFVSKVLNLDVLNVHDIRKKARLGVISTTLLLVAGKVTKMDLSRLHADDMSPEVKYYKEKMDALLNSSLPLEIMVQEVAESLILFASSKCLNCPTRGPFSCLYSHNAFSTSDSKEITGANLEKFQIETLKNSTLSILKGDDLVFSLMDKRMKILFQLAASFKYDKVAVPTEMKSGRQSDLTVPKKTNLYKDQFMNEIGKEARRLGFVAVKETMLRAAYETQKVVSHCLDLYQEDILYPMVKMLKMEKK